MKTKSIALYKLDVSSQQKVLVQELPSLADVLRYFERDPQNNDWRSKYITPGKPYKKVWFMKDVSDSESE